MSVIFHMLKEEQERLLQTQKGYEKLLADLPKGSKQIKHLRNGEYLYLAFRKDGKVTSTYISSIHSKEQLEMEEVKIFQQDRDQALAKFNALPIEEQEKHLSNKYPEEDSIMRHTDMAKALVAVELFGKMEI